MSWLKPINKRPKLEPDGKEKLYWSNRLLVFLWGLNLLWKMLKLQIILQVFFWGVKRQFIDKLQCHRHSIGIMPYIVHNIGIRNYKRRNIRWGRGIKQHKSFLLQAFPLSHRIRTTIRFPKYMGHLDLLEPIKQVPAINQEGWISFVRHWVR